MKVGICGSSGRMGKLLVEEISKSAYKYELVGGYSRGVDSNSLELLSQQASVIIDFSSPLLLKVLLESCSKHATPLVICTTGFLQSDFDLMREYSYRIPILYSANTSIGANLLSIISKILSSNLQDYDIKIVDIHHKKKKDKPSGTALMLAEQINLARKNTDEVECLSLRFGSVIGKHDVIFANDSEIITVRHEVTDRSLFAKGALVAASWLINKKSGFFNMTDVFNSGLITKVD